MKGVQALQLQCLGHARVQTGLSMVGVGVIVCQTGVLSAGGLSNRQKVKQKNLPQGARSQVMKRRLDASRSRGAGFKGRKSRFR